MVKPRIKKKPKPKKYKRKKRQSISYENLNKNLRFLSKEQPNKLIPRVYGNTLINPRDTKKNKIFPFKEMSFFRSKKDIYSVKNFKKVAKR